LHNVEKWHRKSRRTLDFERNKKAGTRGFRLSSWCVARIKIEVLTGHERSRNPRHARISRYGVEERVARAEILSPCAFCYALLRGRTVRSRT
jgi:hypothetical protein